MTSYLSFATPRRLLAALAIAAALLTASLSFSPNSGASPKGAKTGASAAKTFKSGVIRGNPTNKRLATEFLKLLQAKDVPGLNRFLDPAFLLQRGNGTWLDKKGYLAEPAIVDAYEVRNIVVTRSGNVRVVRFEANTTQIIEGEPVPGGWIPRLSTFVRNKNGNWRLIAHANFLLPPAP